MKATLFAIAASVTLFVMPANSAVHGNLNAAAPVASTPPISAQVLPITSAPAISTPATTQVEFNQIGYYDRKGYGKRYKKRRHGRRHRGPRVGDVRIIERPCATRIVRFTPFGKKVRVIRHCGGRHSARFYQNW
ncbi:MAG: hypothetical protein AAF580_14550 [Pseudomonadota bacterium]